MKFGNGIGKQVRKIIIQHTYILSHVNKSRSQYKKRLGFDPVLSHKLKL